jgi:hypothetical protein
MLFRVLDAGTPEGLAAWTDLWSAWPGREVMAHPEYARLFARPCDRVVCAAGRDDAGSILFPLVLRPLAAEPWAVRDERRWDATTPYGYGGPFAWGGAGRDDAELAFLAQHACGDGRRGLDDLERLHHLAADQELAALLLLELTEQVAAVRHRHAGAPAELQ